MEPLHLIIVVPLAAWLGARIGRKVPWSTRRGLLGLVFIVPMALAVGVPAAEVLIDVTMLAVGFLWVRSRGRTSAGAGPRRSLQDRTTDAGVNERGAGHRPSLPPAQVLAIRNRRREEMAQLRAQRRGRKAPIF